MKNNLQKLYFHRLHNLRLMVKLLRLAPFVRCVILNGSMAEGGIKPSSDIDILVIAKSGRIYTARAAVLFWASLTGLKRSNNESKSHAGRFCFNYFLTEGFLTIPHDRGKEVDKYCAKNYSKSILLWGDQKLFEKFMKINLVWMKLYLSQTSNLKSQTYNFRTDKLKNLRIKEQKKFVYSRDLYIRSRSVIQRMIEKLLSKRFGSWLEYTLKNIQIARIKKDPAAKRYPEFIVFNNKELRFHHPKK